MKQTLFIITKYFKKNYLKFKRYLDSQFYIGTDLKTNLFALTGTIFLSIPKIASIESIPLTLGWMIAGASLNYKAWLLGKQKTLQESFLKEMLCEFFDDLAGMEEDVTAEYLKQKLNRGLHHIMEQLGLHQCSHHRIRLFVPVLENNKRKFSLIASHADNPDLGLFRSGLYPDEGVLGYTFRNSTCYENNLPCPKENESDWKDLQMKLAHLKSIESVNEIIFPARSYYGVAIRCSAKRDKIGVIIIESDQINTLQPSQVEAMVLHKSSWYLERCLEKFNKYAPNPTFATEKGF